MATLRCSRSSQLLPILFYGYIHVVCTQFNTCQQWEFTNLESIWTLLDILRRFGRYFFHMSHHFSPRIEPHQVFLHFLQSAGSAQRCQSESNLLPDTNPVTPNLQQVHTAASCRHASVAMTPHAAVAMTVPDILVPGGTALHRAVMVVAGSAEGGLAVSG